MEKKKKDEVNLYDNGSHFDDNFYTSNERSWLISGGTVYFIKSVFWRAVIVCDKLYQS